MKRPQSGWFALRHRCEPFVADGIAHELEVHMAVACRAIAPASPPRSRTGHSQKAQLVEHRRSAKNTEQLAHRRYGLSAVLRPIPSSVCSRTRRSRQGKRERGAPGAAARDNQHVARATRDD